MKPGGMSKVRLCGVSIILLILLININAEALTWLGGVNLSGWCSEMARNEGGGVVCVVPVSLRDM